MDLAIVVVTWNTRKLVLDCLASVQAEERRLREAGAIGIETLLVDNGSSDGTAQAVAQGFPEVRVLRLSRNLGFAAGSNRGIACVRSRYVLLLNSDTQLVPGAIERCVAFLDAHPEVGVVGPQLLHPDGSKQNSVHNFPNIATEVLPKGVFQFLFPRRYPSWRSTGTDPVDVEALVGAAMFLRADLFRSVGPLPEDYFFFMEETDWCWRVREAGWRVVHLPTAFVVHLSGGSSKRKDPALTRIEYHRSLYRFFRRNRGPIRMGLVFVVRFAKSFFYVVTQAPLAALGDRSRTRYRVHREVLVWHLRGCPDGVGLGRAAGGDGA